MRKIINGLAYDTELAERVWRRTNNYPATDFHHEEEILFKTKGGRWFIQYAGGALSQYSKRLDSNSYTGSSGIRTLTEDEAREWLEERANSDIYEKYFEAQEA